MLKYKLLAVDLDGTLLSKSKKISANNFTALHRYTSNGGSCVIMTGRSITSAERYAKQIDDYTQNKSKFVIALNGAYIKNLSTGESITNLIEDNVAKDIYAYAKENKLSTWFYTEESIAKKGVISTWSCLAFILKYLQCIKLFHFKDDMNLSSFKLNILSFSKRKLERAYKWLNEKYGKSLTICFSSAHHIEVSNQNVNKGAALSKVMQWLNVTRDETIVMGDSNNDTAAFEIAGSSVAVKSRSSTLRELSTHRIDFKKDAVAHAIDSYVIASSDENIALIATDLDGTLLQPSTKDIVKSTKLSAQKAVDEKGLFFVICTGRAVDDCLVVLKNLEIKDQSKLFVIGVNGGCIYNVAKREIIYVNYLSSTLASQIYENFIKIANDANRQGEMACQLFALGNTDLTVPQPLYWYNQEYLYKKFKEKIPGMLVNNWAKKEDHNIENVGSIKNIFKMVFHFENIDDRARVMSLFETFGDAVEITPSAPDNIEIMPKNSNKGVGLTRLCSFLNIDIKDTMPIGDEKNDIPMLVLSKHSVTLITAPEIVKNAAAIVLNSKASYLTGQAIDEYVLKTKVDNVK